MNNKLVFIDAETDGLYGEFLSVALIATDYNGDEISRAYYGIRKDKLDVKDEWVKKNVLPKIGNYEECENEAELLGKVWDFWLQYQKEAYAICDVGYPVEMRLFSKCVAMNEKENVQKAPYPLLDISSILLAKGYNPLTDCGELIKDFISEEEHCAMYDVECMVVLWKKLMCEGAKE